MIRAVYSDPHFGHANIIKYEDRPFDSAHEMNETLIEKYNQLIDPEDTVLWLGDCFLMPVDEAKVIMQRLHGEKILIPGNHDRSPSAMAAIGFRMVIPEARMVLNGRRCLFHHYPYPSHPDAHHGDKYAHLKPARVDGQILIHGHTHGKLKRHFNMIHVGVDAWDYYPVTLGTLEAMMLPN